MATQLQEQRKTELKNHLQISQNQIKSLLGDKDRAYKFMAASLIVGNDENLKDCSPSSIVNALVGVAQLDLNPDKNIGHAYLVPYKGSVQLQVGYKGFIQLLFRAGWMIKAYPVYTCDEFSMEFDGWDNKVNFVPDIDNREEDENAWVYSQMRGVFVIARNSETGDEYSDFVSKKIIEKTRMKSQNQKDKKKPSYIWADWYAEMAKKTAIKKLAKALPLGDNRASMAIVIDDKAQSGDLVNHTETAESGVVVDGDGVIQEDKVDLNSVVSGN